ncbi:hypothetical protein ACS0TY_017397 [Phlomoides rotata]
MEFKGIAWAGNIYQKFEAMCLEVEEAMYEDTVKYVENQVQKVGFSVKKFCSAVTEDLLPPSCVYPVNLSSCDLSLNSYGDIDVIKKPIPSIFDTHHDLKKKENEDQVIPNATAEKELSLNGCYDINSLLVQSKSRAPIRRRVGVQRNPIGIKRISRNNHPSNDNCQTNSTSGDRIELASSDKKLMSTLDLDVRKESEKVVGNTHIPDAGIESPVSLKILSAVSKREKEDDQDFISRASGKPSSAESVRQNKDNSDSISPAFENNLLGEPDRLKVDSGSTSSCSGMPSESTGTSVNGVSFSMLESSIRSNTCPRESEGEVVMVSEDTSMKDCSSIVSTTLLADESSDKEILLSDEDGFDMEIIEDDEFAEPRLENFEREKLDESCVMVEGDELCSLSQGTLKHKSYKKKIREALSSKLGSRKDNRHKDLGGENNDEVLKQKEPPRDSVESDWELL